MYSSTCRVPTNEKFDAVIIDVSDPIEAGPAVALYTQEFYQLVSRRLNKHGTFVTQAGSASFIPFPHSSLAGEGDEATCFSPIKNTLATVFDHAIPYSAPVASFVEDWGFVLAFNGSDSDDRELVDLPHEVIDDLIEKQIETLFQECRNTSFARLVSRGLLLERRREQMS